MIIKEKYWHKLFEASIFIKAINGAWETISGLFILLVSKTLLEKIFYFLTKSELAEDPQDKVFSFLVNTVQHFSTGSKQLVGVYILSHGIINIFLAYQLYREKLWSYSVSIVFFSVSVMYLSFRSYSHPSLMIFALILFDIFFVALTWHEYKYRKNQLDQI